jgi:hypothetical protein
MRWLLTLVACSGCFGALDANGRPAVMPKLTELPADPGRRDAVLDSANDTTGPEQRKVSRKQRKVETVAAFAAALVGEAFSKTKNVTFGTATTVDENTLFEKSRPRPPTTTAPSGTAPTDPSQPSEQPTTTPLLPWIKLK